MTMTLTLENPSDELIRAFKNMAKAANVKCKVGKLKEQKLKEQKLKEQKLKEQAYYTLENSPAVRKIDKWAQANPQIAQEAINELEAEMSSYASNPIK